MCDRTLKLDAVLKRLLCDSICIMGVRRDVINLKNAYFLCSGYLFPLSTRVSLICAMIDAAAPKKEDQSHAAWNFRRQDWIPLWQPKIDRQLMKLYTNLNHIARTQHFDLWINLYKGKNILPGKFPNNVIKADYCIFSIIVWNWINFASLVCHGSAVAIQIFMVF